jgi:hypothetical protein
MSTMLTIFDLFLLHIDDPGRRSLYTYFKV